MAGRDGVVIASENRMLDLEKIDVVANDQLVNTRANRGK